MSRALNFSQRVSAVAIFLAFSSAGTTSAQTVWTGFDFSFTRPNDVDFTLPENQDRITSNVWLTRSVQQGIFNIAVEQSYAPTSPAGTEWATNINNPTDTIAATNWANLDFDAWIDAYGGTGSSQLPQRLISRNAVLHLITDNIYLDIQFTSWTGNAAGGGFAYDRSAAPPAPTTTGDYNQNLIVDAADYVVWRDTLGQPAVPPGSGADGDLSGVIDDPDYVFWAAHFGNVVPAAAGLSNSLLVPEPATVVPLLGWLGMLALLPRVAPRGKQRFLCSGRIK